HTTLDLYRFVFVYKRPRLIRVAREAHLVLRSSRSQLAGQESAVLIVTIRAFHKTFIHLVVEGTVELLLLVEVAPVAQSRLLLLQQEIGLLRMVWIVAVRAANPILEVHRAREIAVLLTILVAVKA